MTCSLGAARYVGADLQETDAFVQMRQFPRVSLRYPCATMDAPYRTMAQGFFMAQEILTHLLGQKSRIAGVAPQA